MQNNVKIIDTDAFDLNSKFKKRNKSNSLSVFGFRVSFVIQRLFTIWTSGRHPDVNVTVETGNCASTGAD